MREVDRVKERSIIITDEREIEAILAGKKTQIRVPITPQPKLNPDDPFNVWIWRGKNVIHWDIEGKPPQELLLVNMPGNNHGDRLRVREAWSVEGVSVGDCGIFYKADFDMKEIPHDAPVDDFELMESEENQVGYWRSPATMPKWASRITLEIISARVERLQDITEDDAKDEGMRLPDGTCTMYCGIWINSFARLWNEKYAKKNLSWATNPWVLVREFKLMEGNNAEA